MAFTTWTSLKAEMLDDLQSGKWKIKSYAIGDFSRTFASVDEFLRMLAYVGTEASKESGASGRTYARPVSGGGW